MLVDARIQNSQSTESTITGIMSLEMCVGLMQKRRPQIVGHHAERINEMTKHDICTSCGHYRFLHSAFNGECDACDDPSVPMAEKCAGFKEKEAA